MNKKTQHTLLLGGAVALGAFLLYRMKHKDAVHVGWGGTPYPRPPFPFTPGFRGPGMLAWDETPEGLGWDESAGIAEERGGYDHYDSYVGAPPWSDFHYSGMPTGAGHGRNPALGRSARSGIW